MAASDLANLFGLNNKQESMDTARITSFEPGTFKPVMAGPEVAQGVAAGLYNMGNAVFGAFDNKVKEASRDETAQATDDFLNTLQIAANTVSPEELPLVVSTFSDVLNNNPAILQDKARAALNEISARHSKNLQSLIDANTKLREAELKAASAGGNSDAAKNLAAIKDAMNSADEGINAYAEKNSSAIKDYLITSVLEDFSTLENFDPEDIRSLVQTKLTELQSTIKFPMTMDLQNKILEGVYSAIFNDKNYAAIANSPEIREKQRKHDADQRALTNTALPAALMSGLNSDKFSDDQKANLRATIGEFFSKNWHNISGSRAKWLDDNLGALRYRLENAGITDRDLQLVIMNLAVGGLDITDKAATGKFVDKIAEALANADGTTYNEEAFSELFTPAAESDDSKRPKVAKDLNKIIQETLEGSGHSKTMVEHAKIAGDFLSALLYSQTYRDAINPRLEELSRQLQLQDRALEKDKANSILTYMKGNRTGEDLSKSKLSTYTMLSGGFNSYAQQKAASEQAMSWYLGNHAAAAASNIADATIPMSAKEKEGYASSADKFLGRSKDKSGKAFRVTFKPERFTPLAQEIYPLKNLAENIQQILPEGVSVEDLVIAEGFAVGTYKDDSNVAIGFGNNIKGQTALIKKITQYEENGDLVGLINDTDFREAIYKSVQGEVGKMRKAYEGMDPFSYYLRQGTSEFKSNFNKLSKEEQNKVRHHINGAVFLAYYRGEGDHLKRLIAQSMGKSKFDTAVFNHALNQFMYSPNKNIKMEPRYGRFIFK